mmetsp:Transcript_11968/g.32935  ORF Transcript_11968/g.32935 Transcript_11968/m.32935 type:complete len:247 (+) Transcript_11968:108-848(+)
MRLLKQPHPRIDVLIQRVLHTAAPHEPIHQRPDVVIRRLIDRETILLVPFSQFHGPVNIVDLHLTRALQIAMLQRPLQIGRVLVNVSLLAAHLRHAGVSVEFVDLADAHDGAGRGARLGQGECRGLDLLLQRFGGPRCDVLFFPRAGLVPCRCAFGRLDLGRCRVVQLFGGDVANQVLGLLRQFVVEVARLLAVHDLVSAHGIGFGENIFAVFVTVFVVCIGFAVGTCSSRSGGSRWFCGLCCCCC